MNNPTPKTLSDPQLIDNTLAGVNTALLSGLTWLDNAYGKAQRLVENFEGRNQFYPAVPVQSSLNREYLKLFPDDKLGNFVFWDVRDPERSETFPGEYYYSNVRAGLVVWGNLEKVYPTTFQTKSVENVKREVLDKLTTMFVLGGHIKHVETVHRVENIYPSYNHNEIDSQFLMLPYFGFRVECEIRIRVVCAELEPT